MNRLDAFRPGTVACSTRTSPSRAPAAVLLGAVLLGAVLLLLVSACDTTSSAPDSPAPEALRYAPAGTSNLRLGLTHTQESIDPWSHPDAASRAEKWLSEQQMLQNQHLMGWGALNPEPRPGAYDWQRLDERMALISRTRGEAVLTLCCAPDWMKGGRAGETDWARLEAAPLPEHFDDFAALAREAALRYPEVRHFQVWNEMKGFYLPDENRWDYEGYTDMYNRVYAAVKEARPDAGVGGPYVVMDSWARRDRMSHPSDLSGPWGVLDQRSLDVVSYWLEHNDGAEFVAIDFGTHTRNAGLITDPFRATGKFRDVIAWVREQTDLPIWLAEWYTAGGEDDLQMQTAIMATAIIEMARSGVDAALQWGPQAGDDGCAVGGCLWTDSDVEEGGRPTPLARAFEAFGSAFPPGTALFDVQGLPGDVGALASSSHVLLVNQADGKRAVRLGTEVVELSPYEVVLETRSN